MNKIPRRDKLRLYGDLLSVLKSEGDNEKIVLTRVQTRLNVPFDRLKNYIIELKELGLVEDETSLKLTEKGKQYLKEYKQILDFMKRMGLIRQHPQSRRTLSESHIPFEYNPRRHTYFRNSRRKIRLSCRD